MITHNLSLLVLVVVVVVTGRSRDNFWAIGKQVLDSSSSFLTTYLGILRVHSVFLSTQLGCLSHFNSSLH